jgi:5-formyltetrahydrofolate cyclo-ligase
MRGMDERQYVSVTNLWREQAERQARIRREVRAARASRNPAEVEAAGAALRDRVLALPEMPSTACVTAYLPLPAEPPTGPLLETLSDRGCRILVPRIAGERRLDWVEWSTSVESRPGPWGIVEPIGPAVTLDAAEVLIIPATAADPVSGVRIGQGGGYYDRVLESLPDVNAGGPLRVALLFDGEVLDGLPAQPWDGTVDVIVTPTRTLRTGRSTERNAEGGRRDS